MHVQKVGFWRSKETPSLPRPKLYGKWWPGRKRFIRQLKQLEAYIDTLFITDEGHVEHYKGWSDCRICGTKNGSSEYIFKNHRWPSGYRHYVIKHSIKPPKSFRRFVAIHARKLKNNDNEQEETLYRADSKFK